MGSTAKGQAGGLATLNASGKVPAAQVAGVSAVAPLTATATLDFGSATTLAVVEQTVTVTGAAIGDKVVLGAPSTLETGLIAFGFVSATNTVKIRLLNGTASTVDPASASWKVAVFTS